jgi:hypothetical protein
MQAVPVLAVHTSNPSLVNSIFRSKTFDILASATNIFELFLRER